MLNVPRYLVALVLVIKILSVQPSRGLCWKYSANNRGRKAGTKVNPLQRKDGKEINEKAEEQQNVSV